MTLLEPCERCKALMSQGVPPGCIIAGILLAMVIRYGGVETHRLFTVANDNAYHPPLKLKTREAKP